MEYRSTLKAFNLTVLLSWILFSVFLLNLPWLANPVNRAFRSFSSDYLVHDKPNETNWKSGKLRQKNKVHHEDGLCDTPANEIICADGQNFTELAMRYRGTPYGCGCGQGILGESLCPLADYGYSLNTYVSTAPAMGILLGLGAFPLMGTWKHAEIINKQASPGEKLAQLHWYSLLMFQIAYTLWGVFPGCTFPIAHGVLHSLFLAAFILHWVVKAFICWHHWGVWFVQAQTLLILSVACVFSMTTAALFRIYADLHTQLGGHVSGSKVYVVFFAEVIGLCISFGTYPIMLISINHGPGSEEFQLVDFSALTTSACKPAAPKPEPPQYRRGENLKQERRACRTCFLWS